MSMAAAWKRLRSPQPGGRPPRRGPLRPATSLRSPYEGAEQNRFLEDWLVSDHEPRELISAYLTILRQRSRDLARHAPAFISAIGTIVDNVIGAAGFRVNPTPRDADGEPNEGLGKQLAGLWEQWEPEADIDRRESLSMLLRTAVQEYIEAGEVFLREVAPPDDDRVVPLAIEVVPAERVDHTLERNENPRDQSINGNPIRNGIEFNRKGQRVAYWVSRVDEWGRLGPERERVPADRMHHVFHRARALQERGLPWLAGAAVLCHDLDDLMDSELTSAQVAACLTGFIQRQQANVFGSGQERDAEDSRPIHRFTPGSIFDLQPGESVTTVDPNRPAGTFEPFANFILRCLARTLGISYESMSGDYRQVNFASGRLGHLIERRTYRRVQAVIAQLAVRPVWRAFVRAGVLIGAVDLSLIDYVQNWRRHTRAEIAGPGWEHHDPLKEVSAAALRIYSGLSSVDEEAAALGRDWEAIVEQRRKEMEAFEAAGLPMVLPAGAALLEPALEEPEHEPQPLMRTPRARLARPAAAAAN